MDTSDAVTIIISAAAVIVASVAAYFALAQSLHAREQADIAQTAYRDQVQPYIFADIRPDTKDPGVLVLVIENSGKTVARDVRVTFDPPLQSVGLPGNFTAHAATELEALPPGRRMTWLFDIGFRLFEAESQRLYRINVAANGPFGRLEPLAYYLNLDEYRGHEARDVGTMKALVEAVVKNSKGLKEISTELRELRRGLRRSEESGSDDES